MEKKDKQLDDEGFVIRINKEEEKRKREEIKDFVKALLKMANDKYANLPIDVTLRAALEEGKRLTGNAYKRHLSFIVRLVHEQNFEEILAVYERVHHPYRNDPGKIREIESYRDRLLDGDKEVINEIIGKFADVDIQFLRQLARNTNKERKDEIKNTKALADKYGHPYVEPTKPTKSAKLLYQYLFKLNLL